MEKLIIKYLTNNATTSEIEELQEWIQLKKNEELFEDYIRVNFISNHNAISPDILKNKKALLENTRKTNSFFNIKKLKKVYRYAAVFMGLIALTVYLNKEKFQLFEDGQNLQETKLVIANEHVILKNEKGEIQVLDETTKNIAIQNAGGNKIAQKQGNEVSYDLGLQTSEELVYNEMFVPYGKRFQVVLSDGTKVHLNSGTSLRYPTKFIAGKERKVFVEGEAFFDVAKSNGLAFVVNAKAIDIKVLGTKFNVSSYKEDDNINTVLVEGRVQVANASNPDNKTLLEPSEMASWNKVHKDISINNVDVNLHTAWMDGKLILRKTPFKVIREKLERYYNVTIVNKNKGLDNLRYNMNFDNETIEQVLKTLNENFEINYTINSNEIIIN